MSPPKIFFKLLLVLLLLTAVLTGGAWFLFGPVESQGQPIILTVTEDQNRLDVTLKLKEQKLIRNDGAFLFLLNLIKGEKAVLPGGYRLNSQMNAWQILQKITSVPDLVWVVIPEGLRKEQIGERLAKALNWSGEDEKKWNEIYTASKPEYTEGVYFPDTYLIPRDEAGKEVAQRFINRFNEQMAPLFDQFSQKNILWTTGLKIASLIQREAGGTADMPLISGVIWNRLDKGTKLEIDATLQYVRGKTEDGWWGKVNPADKQVDSPYNTYRYKGLPPHPIANPGLPAIEAALNPVETDCLYYLHDTNKEIHCAKTYPEHLANIKKYL